MENLLFVVAAAEALPGPLRARADRVTVILPWGSLLRGLIEPRPAALARLRALCRPAAHLELVASYGARDRGHQHGEEDILNLDDAHARGLVARYDEAGFSDTVVERVPLAALRDYPTTWAKRLAYGRPRDVYRIRTRAAVGSSETPGRR